LKTTGYVLKIREAGLVSIAVGLYPAAGMHDHWWNKPLVIKT
jgi:hypothetical protein